MTIDKYFWAKPLAMSGRTEMRRHVSEDIRTGMRYFVECSRRPRAGPQCSAPSVAAEACPVAEGNRGDQCLAGRYPPAGVALTVLGIVYINRLNL